MTNPEPATGKPEVGTLPAIVRGKGAKPARTTTPASIEKMLTAAIEKGLSVEQMKELVGLHRQVSDHQAEIEFARAMAGFQADCPVIPKSSKASVVTKSGASYSYKYAELDQIAEVINPIARKYGLSYSWDTEFGEKMLTCTCTVRHVNGHKEKSKFACSTEPSSPGMNKQQESAAALTYAKRQALVQAFGLTTGEPDTDGASDEVILDDQATELQAFVESVVPEAEREDWLRRFWKYMGVKRFVEIKKRDMNKAVKAVEQYAAKKKAEPAT